MGLFDSLKNMFAHHEHHHGASIGQPLTLADAKAVLAFIVVHQQLADMRKVADAVKQLQDEMPQYITFGMSHYYSEPKRVRFQSEGGKFIDADAIATAFAETTVLQDECKIQHLMGDIEDNREAAYRQYEGQSAQLPLCYWLIGKWSAHKTTPPSP